MKCPKCKKGELLMFISSNEVYGNFIWFSGLEIKTTYKCTYCTNVIDDEYEPHNL